jgi:hypothetical protein
MAHCRSRGDSASPMRLTDGRRAREFACEFVERALTRDHDDGVRRNSAHSSAVYRSHQATVTFDGHQVRFA